MGGIVLCLISGLMFWWLRRKRQCDRKVASTEDQEAPPKEQSVIQELHDEDRPIEMNGAHHILEIDGAHFTREMDAEQHTREMDGRNPSYRQNRTSN